MAFYYGTLRGLHGNYGVHMAVMGSTLQTFDFSSSSWYSPLPSSKCRVDIFCTHISKCVGFFFVIFIQ